MSYVPGRPNYQHHAGFYRSVNPDADLSKPWEQSPFSSRSLPMSPFKPVFDLPMRKLKNELPSSPSPQASNILVVMKEKSLWDRIIQFMKSGNFTKHTEITMTYTPEPPNPHSEKVPLAEWKQYGYWARPFINGVACINSPVTSEKSLSTEAFVDLITRVRGPEDPEFDERPENWIIGAKHRAFPKRPARWIDPNPNEPLPFPWEVQINPLLQHLLWGPSALRWCIWNDPNGFILYGRTQNTVPCQDADKAQPATWPFLTHMHFNAVLGDDAYHYPWPFTVYNPRGIKVGDILNEIYRNFRIVIREEEHASWPRYRKDAANATLEQRVHYYRDLGQPLPPHFQCMRRHDALGARMWFRGIEPSVDGGGWTLVFGPY